MGDIRNVDPGRTSFQVEAKTMNTTLRTSLVSLLSIIPILVMTGCGTATPGVAQPAATTSSSSSAVAPTQPSSQQPSSQEPTSQEPTSQEPSSQEPTAQQPSGPAVLPTDLSGEVYGFIRAVDVDQSQLTVDKVDWFWGVDAEQACTEDAVPQEAHLDGWCSIYYFRNVNPKLRVVSARPDAVITTLQGTTPVSQDLPGLADRVGSPGGEYRPYRILVVDGAIVELTQIYQP